jgi:hypothetical protein
MKGQFIKVCMLLLSVCTATGTLHAQAKDPFEKWLGTRQERKIVEQPKWSVGTNLLEWIGVVPGPKFTAWGANLNAEYYFKEKYSVKLIAAYSNHGYGKNKSKFQGFTSYTLEPRYWFQKDGTFTGFYAAPYFQLGDFNDENTERKLTGTFWGAGVSGGYMYPLWRGLTLELNLGLGYRHAGAKRYTYNGDCVRCFKQKENKNQFVLSSLALNLQWRFK